MALKDWKKIGDAHWINQHFNNDLEILQSMHKTYKLYVEHNRMKTIVFKEFKSKSTALKFAKSYMRKH
jgi:hypothetical protein